MSVYNVLGLCMVGDPWADFFKESNKLNLVHLVTWRDFVNDFSGIIKSNKDIVEIENAWFGDITFDGIEYRYIDEDFEKKYSADIIVMIDMIKRQHPYGFMRIEEVKHHLYDMINKYINIIIKKDIKVVISPSIPHRVFDYSVYVASKFTNTLFTTFQSIHHNDRVIPLNGISEIEYWVEGNFKYKSLPKSSISRMVKLKNDYKEAKPNYLIEQERYIKNIMYRIRSAILNFDKKKLIKPNTYWFKDGEIIFGKRYNWITYYYQNIKNILYLLRLKSEYKKNVNLEIPGYSDILNNKYVFVALHYQPEETTVPSGGFYSDQIQIIKLLVDALPDNIDILVKEHPSQFNLLMEGYSSRSINFYRKLRSISERVKILGLNSSIFDVIDQSLFVVTVTGTIGFESLVRDKPVMIFGRAWYEKFNGVFKVKSRTDIIDGCKKIIMGKYNIKIHKDYLKLINNTLKFTHYKKKRKGSTIQVPKELEEYILRRLD